MSKVIKMNLIGNVVFAFLHGCVGGSFTADYVRTRSALSGLVALLFIVGGIFWSAMAGLSVLIPELVGFVFIIHYARNMHM
jgi:hypothetical protein